MTENHCTYFIKSIPLFFKNKVFKYKERQRKRLLLNAWACRNFTCNYWIELCLLIKNEENDSMYFAVTHLNKLGIIERDWAPQVTPFPLRKWENNLLTWCWLPSRRSQYLFGVFLISRYFLLIVTLFGFLHSLSQIHLEVVETFADKKIKLNAFKKLRPDIPSSIVVFIMMKIPVFFTWHLIYQISQVSLKLIFCWHSLVQSKIDTLC